MEDPRVTLNALTSPYGHHNVTIQQVEDLKGKIRVFARVRPLSESESVRGCLEVTSLLNKTTLELRGTRSGATKRFTFDACFSASDSQSAVFA